MSHLLLHNYTRAIVTAGSRTNKMMPSIKRIHMWLRVMYMNPFKAHAAVAPPDITLEKDQLEQRSREAPLATRLSN